MRKALLASIGAALLTSTVIALGQSFPGVNSPYQLVWAMVWEQATLKPTYSAAGTVTSTSTAAQNVCALSGSSTKTMRVRRVVVSGSAGAVESVPVSITKYSTLYTNNGSVTGAKPTIVPLDSGSSAATGVVETWTSNATDGTLVGALVDEYIGFPNTTTGLGTGAYSFNFGLYGGSALVLRGTAQYIAVNLGAINFNTGVLQCTFEWTEES